MPILSVGRSIRRGFRRKAGYTRIPASPDLTNADIKEASKTKKKKKIKTDWFPVKFYRHFDGPFSRAKATKLVEDRCAVAKHSFLPLIAFEKIERRFKHAKKGKPSQTSTKIRRLTYCSNKDTCVFSYYASLLNSCYERYIKEIGLDENVIGYRKIGSNIDLACAAFSEIQTRGSCVAFAFDISGFFDNIDHAILKRNWARVLGEEQLPNDHYNVFWNLTHFSTVDRRACLKRLGLKPSATDRDLKPGPLCTMEEYKTKIRNKDGSLPNLVVPWKRKHRIPQGTPLSALAANIAMIDFDILMRELIKNLEGSYRRYSDDILVIVPSSKRQLVEPIIVSALRTSTRCLRIKQSKTNIIEFLPGALEKGRGSRPLQYLGFMFDGEKSFLRSSTIAKFYRRMRRGVASARKQQKKVRLGEITGRDSLHRRKLLLKHSHLGKGNFLTTYAKAAKARLPNNAIGRQMHGHLDKLKNKTK